MSRVRSVFLWSARLAVAGIFLGACIAKIRDPAAFALAVNRYRILPGEFVNLIAIVLPWIELTAGLAVLAAPARLRAAGALIIAGMLAVFTVAISLNLLRGIEASCGCFSTRADAAVSDGWNLVRNGALIWLSLAVFFDAFRRAATPGPREIPVSARLQSIFEVYAVGAGPSSTHSMGPQRAARLFVAALAAAPAHIRVTLFGSLAATGRGHWTDRTLLRTLEPIRVDVVFDTRSANLPHPNTMKFEAFDAAGTLLREWTVCSIGGGNLREADGRPVASADPAEYPLANIAEALDYCRANQLALWQVAERTERDLWPRLGAIWKAMADTIKRGLGSKQILLPGTLELARRAGTTWRRARDLKGTQRDLGLVASFALAVAEENAAGMQVVTAPSCGAAGVLPAVLYFFQTVRRIPKQRILEALATAGLFGASIRANATVSGAEAGCQAEIGSACSMAAAAAAQLCGASLNQIEYAAEMAMEHNLGLTCDPIEGYVQIPCIERNMNAALRAIECAAFTRLTDGRHLISFDDVIEVMNRTGRDLQAAYRETATGGLARLWRRDIENRLRKPAAP